MDIRGHVGKQLRGYRVTQGACCEDGHIYMIFERKKPHACKIVKMKADAKKTIIKVSDSLQIGHGNDLCYWNGMLWITHSGKSKVIHKVNAVTLRPAGYATVKGVKAGWFNGITRYGSGFMLKKMGGSYVYITDGGFRVKKRIKLSKKFNTSQGICWNEKTRRLYRASSKLQSKKNYVSKYTAGGKYAGRHHVKLKCELEGVFFIGDHLYVTYYRKYKKGKKKHYEAHIKMVK